MQEQMYYSIGQHANCLLVGQPTCNRNGPVWIYIAVKKDISPLTRKYRATRTVK